MQSNHILPVVQCANVQQQYAFQKVIDERRYQDKKWGPIEERQREVGTYLTLMRSLLTEAERAYTKSRGDEPALNELRKVIAVGMACLEQHGVPGRIESC